MPLERARKPNRPPHPRRWHSQPTQAAKIERNSATALYGDDTYKGSIYKPEREGFTAEEARHDPRPMKWDQQRRCYVVVSDEQRAAAVKPMAPAKATARQFEDDNGDYIPGDYYQHAYR